MQVPPDEKFHVHSLQKYEEVLKTVPLDFEEDDITWITSKISGAAGKLGSEEIELRNWLI